MSQAHRFIEEHCRQVAPSKAAATKKLVPIMYVLFRDLAELYAIYLAANIMSQLVLHVRAYKFIGGYIVADALQRTLIV